MTTFGSIKQLFILIFIVLPSLITAHFVKKKIIKKIDHKKQEEEKKKKINKEQLEEYRRKCIEVVEWLNSTYLPKLITDAYKQKIKRDIDDTIDNSSSEEAIRYKESGKIPEIKAKLESDVSISFYDDSVPEEIPYAILFLLEDIVGAIYEEFKYDFDIFDDNSAIYIID